MAIRRAGKRGQRDRVSRDIDQLVTFGVIEVMMMFGVGIENAVLIMDGDAPQQAGLGELVQRVVDSTASHMRSGVTNLAGKAFSGHMAVPSIKQQFANQQSLTRRPQAGITKTLRQGRLANCVTVIPDHFNHCAQKHAALVMSCQ